MFWLAWFGCGRAAVDYDVCGAFVEGSFSLFVRLVFLIIESGGIVLDGKQVGLFCAKAAGYTADFAH